MEIWSKLGPALGSFDWLSWVQGDVTKILGSFTLIFLVLITLSAIYRGGAGDEELEKPVSLSLLSNADEDTLVLAPRHLRERSTHHAKAPRVEFFLQVPQRGRYDFKALRKPLRLSIRGRNSSMVYDHEYARDLPTKGTILHAEGGQLGVDAETRDLIEKFLDKLNKSEGRKFDADTATFVVKLRYPASINLAYLLRDHPDVGVRTGAWIFILTSVFSVAQEFIFRG